MTTPKPQLTAKAVFDRAHEFTAPEERRAYLDEVCGDNAELRHRVEVLLDAYDTAGSFLDRPMAEMSATSDDAPGDVTVVGNRPHSSSSASRTPPQE